MSLLEPVFSDSATVNELVSACGHDHVSVMEPDRIAYARDMWPRSLISQRGGSLDRPPDVIVWPANTEQVAKVVRVARRTRLPLIPFGAGSGVCGGTLPLRGGILVDLKRLDRVLKLDQDNRLLRVEAGIIGENLERELNRQGFTCGHFPSSIYCSTVGGWIAARGAGQCSSRYGKIEDMVRLLTFVDQAGEIRTSATAPSGCEPWSLNPLLVGSEGTLGIITEATIVLRRLSPDRWLRGYRFPDVPSGAQAMRLMLRMGLRPSVLRLYDEFDTLIARPGPGPVDEEVGESLLRSLGGKVGSPLKGLLRMSLPKLLMAPNILNRIVNLLPGGCLLIVMQEGPEEERTMAAEIIADLCRSRGAVDLGEEPGIHWWKNRYSISYKQSPMFASGAFVDTMEVATTWDRLLPLYRAVRRALSPLAFVMAHLSHAYREGCSIYFTFASAARDDAAAAGLYDRIWEAAQSAVIAEGATVSHHHGIGAGKQRFLVRQQGEAHVLAEAVKSAFDADGLFNPGKLGLRGIDKREAS